MLSDLNLALATENLPEPEGMVSDVPLATPEDFYPENRAADLSSSAWSEHVVFHNAATCPDCAGAMIRQGRCCVCPSCGFESCVI